jgi:hypothetical protein
VAVPRKGWRSIAVSDHHYFWRAIGRDWSISVVVVTEAAFARAGTAQQLRFELSYDPLREKRPQSETHHQRAVVSPAVVRRAIEIATELTPPFTGDHGKPHMTLPAEFDDAIRELARVEPALARAFPRLSQLDPEDRAVICSCLRAAADGPFFDDAEFGTLFWRGAGRPSSTRRELACD